MAKRGISYTRLATVVLFVLLTLVGTIFSIYLFMLSHSIQMYIVSAAFASLTLISGVFNIITSYLYYRSYLYDSYLKNIQKNLKKLTVFPTVAIAMPVFNEDENMVKKNLLRLKEMDYPKEKMGFYLLDDSTDQNVRNRLKKFSKDNGITYMHRGDRKGYKAGALNNLAMKCKEDFLAIFDYDEYLVNTSFLKDALPYFQDDKLSYVQTEKKYAANSFFSDSINLFDAFFFKFIQPARALNNTAIFAGSCGVVKTSYLKKIGGFPEYVIEDTFFSFESDSNGYNSLYLPKVYATGKPITTFSELVQQQWRYNYGNTQFLMYLLERFRQPRKKKVSYLDYIIHGFGLNYISVVLLLFTLVSILIVFSQFNNISSITLNTLLHSTGLTLDLELLGMLAFVLSVLTPVILTKIHFKSISKGFMISLLNFALVFIRVKAAFSAIFQRDYKVLWDGARMNLMQSKTIYAVRNSLPEILFSSSLFVFSGIALTIDNLSGGVWLLWYGVLYVSTFYMFYKYG